MKVGCKQSNAALCETMQSLLRTAFIIKQLKETKQTNKQKQKKSSYLVWLCEEAVFHIYSSLFGSDSLLPLSDHQCTCLGDVWL